MEGAVVLDELPPGIALKIVVEGALHVVSRSRRTIILALDIDAETLFPCGPPRSALPSAFVKGAANESRGERV